MVTYDNELNYEEYTIGHFWVAPSLCFKARLSAKTSIDMKMIYKHANEIHSHIDGFAISLLKKWEILEVGNGLQG